MRATMHRVAFLVMTGMFFHRWAALNLATLLLLGCHAPQSHASPAIKSFDLADVRLSPNTFQARAMASNAEYLMSLETDRLLFAFRWGLAGVKEQHLSIVASHMLCFSIT